MEGIKVGCDIVCVPRFQKMIKATPKVLEKIFTPRERIDQSIEHLAGIFAAKEAAIKALSLAPGQWQTLEVTKQKNGQPQIIFKNPERNRRIKKSQLSLSISHDGDYALATVLVFL